MFVIEPTLRILPAPDKWVVTAPGRWESTDLSFRVPVGWITDLASIPRVLRAVLDVNGLCRYPAIAHDWLYNRQVTSREFADEAFRRALIAYGMSALEARTYWLGVRAGGWSPWNARLVRGGGLRLEDFQTVAQYRAALASLDAHRP